MVLIVLMFVATLLLIALTVSLPSVYQDGQREREAELIFRGTQYARAVALFHRQFNRYPVSIKELLQTNGMRFLREEYRDPMDPKGKWRFIHVNAAGVLLDSINQPMGNCGNPAGLGQTGSSSSSSSSFGSSSSSSAFGSSPGGFGGGGFGGGGGGFGGGMSGMGSGMGGSSQPCPQGGNSPLGGTPFGGSSASGFGNSSSFQSGQSGMMGGSSFGGSGQSGNLPSFFGGSSNGVQGAFIAGVAATTHHESIRVWQKHHHYDEWEFVGIDMGALGIQVGMPGGGGGGGGGMAPLGNGQQGSSPGSGFGSSPGGFGSSPGGFGSSPSGPGGSGFSSN